MKVRLGDVCDILNGFSFKSDKYVKEGIRIIRIANVQKGYVEDDDPVYYPLDSSGLEKYMLEEDDLLISLTGNVGRVALLQKDMLPAALNQRVACLRLKNNVLTKGFLFHVLNSNLFEQRCIHSSKGVAQKNMSTEWLKNYEIPLYSIEKQLKITKILDSVKQIINSRQKELSDLDTLIKARFVEMFGNPHTNQKKWKECPLSEKLNVLGGYAFKSNQFEEKNGIPILRIGNINSGYFKPVNMVYWQEDERLERYAMYPGDLVMSLTGTVGKDDYGNVCILGNDYEMYYLNQRNAKLEIREGIDKYYLSYLLKFEQIKKKLTGISRGVRQANISNKDILNLVVPIPPLSLQNEFATFVQQIDKLRFGGRKRLTKAKNTKNNNRNTITLERSTLYGK